MKNIILISRKNDEKVISVTENENKRQETQQQFPKNNSLKKSKNLNIELPVLYTRSNFRDDENKINFVFGMLITDKEILKALKNESFQSVVETNKLVEKIQHRLGINVQIWHENDEN